MSEWLDPVRMALDGDANAAPLFFRDDDAGWEHERLRRLLEVFAGCGVPIDVAMIPASATRRIVADVRRVAHSSDGCIDIHQHGFTHHNHEPNGRTSEFGPSRSIDEQRRDIAEGKRRLEDLVGDGLRPIFTPPWNRCTDATVECLRELGFTMLSRDASAGLTRVHGVTERPVTLDWCGKRGVRQAGLPAWGHAIASGLQAAAPVGIMLHHAVMRDDDLDALSALLRLLSRHPGARLRTISTL
jgi:predicted deacetylase